MSQVMKAHVLDSGLGADPAPEREMGVMRTLGIAHGRKHERALSTGLPFDDAPRLNVEVHLPRPGLGVREGDGVSVDLVPSQGENLALAAAGQQQQPDDVGLARALRTGSGMSVECAMQPLELIAGEEAGQRGAPVHGHVARGIDFDMAAGDGELENLSQDAQRVIGAAGSGSAVGVEPVQDFGSGDAVEGHGAEGGQELAEDGVHAFPRRGLVVGEVGVLPWAVDEVAEHGNRSLSLRRMFGVGLGHEGVALAACVVDAS